MRCCVGNHKCETAKLTVGLTPVPAAHCEKGSKYGFCHRRLINDAVALHDVNYLYSAQFSAVLLFYTAVNYLDTTPVENPYYFVMEKKELCSRNL